MHCDLWIEISQYNSIEMGLKWNELRNKIKWNNNDKVKHEEEKINEMNEQNKTEQSKAKQKEREKKHWLLGFRN